MPLAALTPVLNDLLHKEGGNSSPYPQHSAPQQAPTSTDTQNTADYLRRSSLVPNPLAAAASSTDDVSVFSSELIIFVHQNHSLR